MEIEVKGHSGCSIDIIRQNNKLIIEKGTRDPKYVERLYQQAVKQKKACETQLQFIRIPQILNITKTDKEMVMQMEYVYSKNFVDYFENAGFEQVNYFVKAIDIFLKSEIDHSQLTEVPASVVLDKWEDVKLKTTTNQFTGVREDVREVLRRSEIAFLTILNPLNLSELPDIQMPVGVCHGDLTLSNILFNGNNYFLIDFLDSFIESPLLDMVKIRQDTAHRWSPLMYEGSYDKTRFNIIADKIDSELDNLFQKYDWYVKYYDMFQLMNLLRVLQYGHEEVVVVYLCEEISKILDKIESKTGLTGLNSSNASNEEYSQTLKLSSPQSRSIIIPIAADKPEYETIMPHVFRMNNNGIMLCIAGIMGLELESFDKIYFTILKKHSEHFRLREMMEVQQQRLGLDKKAVVVELEEPTASQPDTIYTTIQKMNITGSILVKDADCYFEGEQNPGNSIFTYPLDSMSQVNPQGKSYVQTDDMCYITNIIERRIIGRDFCAGGYYFEDTNAFLKYYNDNKQYVPLYMSHVIYSALLDGLSFRPVKVKTYKDWGTISDWNRSESYES